MGCAGCDVCLCRMTATLRVARPLLHAASLVVSRCTLQLPIIGGRCVLIRHSDGAKLNPSDSHIVLDSEVPIDPDSVLLVLEGCSALGPQWDQWYESTHLVSRFGSSIAMRTYSAAQPIQSAELA
jgi:hypothetical protein